MWDRGLKIINVATPETPALTASLALDGRATGIRVVGDYAYIADDSGGLKIINIETPQAPVLIGTQPTSGESSGVAAVGNYAYLADGEQGLKVIRLQSKTPIVSNVFKSGTEGTTVTFSTTDFTDKFSDVDGDSLTKIKITTLPSNGFLKLLDDDVSVNREIDAGKLNTLTFNPAIDWYGSTSFGWKGSDRFVYSDDSADVRITLAKKKGHLTEDSSSGEEDKQHFCDEYWWSCYVIPPVIAAGCAITTATVAATIYLHKKKMWCFGASGYGAIN